MPELTAKKILLSAWFALDGAEQEQVMALLRPSRNRQEAQEVPAFRRECIDPSEQEAHLSAHPRSCCLRRAEATPSCRGKACR